ncbi:MAG TPA: ABC transporter ATP-binding protein [Nitrososphaeraceae archaeon]|nr:ABC transporter ATP-binding protein [Nitrososphaeraceae archaeon]
MALIETPHYNITESSNNSQERQDQQKQENLDFIPVLHVKDVYKSFDYKNNKNNRSCVTTTHDRLDGEQQQQLNSSRGLRASSYEVLNGVNLKIKEGEFVTIVGPSGCGKSTLLNIIAGLDRPDSGSVIIRGAVASNDTALTKRIMIFQEGALFPWLNVQDNVEFGLNIAKMPKEKSGQVADKYIEMVGLSKFSESFVHQLSGGMKQRVAIARALAIEPEVLLMDEPFAALDVQTRNLLHEELVGIHKTTGKTILFVTHNINEAILLGDRVIILSSVLKNIKKEFRIDLPQPRDPESPELYEIKKQILREFEGDLQIAKRG